MIPPRPWAAVEGEIDRYSVNTEVSAWIEHSQEEPVIPWPLDKDLADHIVRAVNAFDALLSFAKSVEPTIHDADTVQDHCVSCGNWHGGHEAGCALERLDRDHAGWREWSA